MPVRLKAAAPPSRVKHSTTEPLRSLRLNEHPKPVSKLIDKKILTYLYTYTNLLKIMCDF